MNRLNIPWYFCSEVHAHTKKTKLWLYISMNVVCAWCVSWNDWNVPHVPWPHINAPIINASNSSNYNKQKHGQYTYFESKIWDHIKGLILRHIKPTATAAPPQNTRIPRVLRLMYFSRYEFEGRSPQYTSCNTRGIKKYLVYCGDASFKFCGSCTAAAAVHELRLRQLARVGKI